MPLRYEIDPHAEIARVWGDGNITMPAAIATIQEVAADPLFKPHFKVVFDLRRCGYTAELKDGDELAEVLRQRKNNFQNSFAVVVPQSLHILAHLYCLLSKMAGFDKIMAFTDMSEAEQWLRSS